MQRLAGLGMAKSSAQRMRELRDRQRESGLVTTTLVIPAADIQFFREMARVACGRASGRALPISKSPIQPKGLTPAQEKLAFQWSAYSGLKVRLTKAGVTLSELLAMNISLEINRLGFPVGRVLGSEGQLMERYGVSRNVLRDAVRILEQQTIASMTKGPDGGLVVTEQRMDPAAYIGGEYLEYRGITPDQMMEIRRLLEHLAVSHVIGRLHVEGEKRLLALIDTEDHQASKPRLKHTHRFHLLLAEMSGNPALHLFLDIILRELRFHNWDKDTAGNPWGVQAGARAAHRRIANAILARDVAKAQTEMSSYLDAVSAWYRQ